MEPKTVHIRNGCPHDTAVEIAALFRTQFSNSLIKGGWGEATDGDLFIHVGGFDHTSDPPPGSLSLAVFCKRCATAGGRESITASVFDEVIFTPFSAAELLFRVQRLIGPIAIETEAAKKNLLVKLGMEKFIGRDSNFLAALEKLPLLADSDATIVLSGETGVGKEVCARALHYLSGRAGQPFVAVNCGALNENLAENELFGHKKGAFTDARTDNKGLVAEAEGGTLFLDEINSLTLATQSKLLRLLQEKTYRPLGHTRNVSADIRILAASNDDLMQLVREGSFREDLYYRLTVTLKLPALRERRSDIPLLANHFIKKYTREGDRPKRFSAASLRTLMTYDWPGNIRELENVVQQCNLLCPGTLITPEHIPLNFSRNRCSSALRPFKLAKQEAVARFEREYVSRLLVACDGNITYAAEKAQKDRGDFSRLVKRYKISHDYRTP